MTLPRVQPEREPMTVAEAMAVGRNAQYLALYASHIQSKPLNATLKLQYAQGESALQLSHDETMAVISLLRDRHAAFLAAFNIDMTGHL